MFRTLLGLPFAILCYLFLTPASLFGSIACIFGSIGCKIRGKDFPGMKSSN